tara:strand:+ start:1447 stop:1602 length:156 start_codon:yes stop_codon:yes gene_type:complete
MGPDNFKDHKQIQLDRIEEKLDNLEKKLDDHISKIWEVYEPIKKILKMFKR